MEDTAFKGALRCRWKQVRQSSVSATRINQLIDSVVTLTTEARQRHFIRWPVLGVTIWPNPTPVPKSYEEEITVLKDWIDRRLDWLDKNIPNTGACYNYPPEVKENMIVKLSPNPVTENAALSIQARTDQQLMIHVYDINGRLVLNRQLNISAGVNQVNLATRVYATGVYVLKLLSSNGETSTIKFIRE
jgi:Secretion system C-terminal sorting domain/CotH kinase protein